MVSRDIQRSSESLSQAGWLLGHICCTTHRLLGDERMETEQAQDATRCGSGKGLVRTSDEVSGNHAHVSEKQLNNKEN